MNNMNCTGSKVGREGDEAAIIQYAYLTIDSTTAILATAGNLFCRLRVIGTEKWNWVMTVSVGYPGIRMPGTAF